MRQCEVYNNGVKAGILTEKSDSCYEFVYDKHYLASGAPAISLTLPLQSEPAQSPFLFPFFASLLSEGANRETQCGLLHIDDDDDFGLLLATAGCDTIGAITVKPL